MPPAPGRAPAPWPPGAARGPRPRRRRAGGPPAGPLHAAARRSEAPPDPVDLTQTARPLEKELRRAQPRVELLAERQGALLELVRPLAEIERGPDHTPDVLLGEADEDRAGHETE